MGTKDLRNNIAASASLHPAARTAAANGTGVDTRGYDSVAFLCHFGAVADGYFEYNFQESDDDVSYTDVAAADLDGSEPTAFGESPDSGANTVSLVGYKGSSRYVRAQLTQGLSPAPATGCLTSAVVLLGHAHGRPTQS